MARIKRPIHYMNRHEVARYIGIAEGTIHRYKMPPPDAYIGRVRGWLPRTIDAWQATRRPRVKPTEEQEQ